MHEADISSDATPPINARQGLLFESVHLTNLRPFFLLIETLSFIDGGVYFGFYSKPNQTVVAQRMDWYTHMSVVSLLQFRTR